jgi:hypothetical protein
MGLRKMGYMFWILYPILASMLLIHKDTLNNFKFVWFLVCIFCFLCFRSRISDIGMNNLSKD